MSKNSEAISTLVRKSGHDPVAILEYATDRDVRADLDACFAQAIATRSYGVPTFIVDGEPFWGESSN